MTNCFQIYILEKVGKNLEITTYQNVYLSGDLRYSKKIDYCTSRIPSLNYMKSIKHNLYKLDKKTFDQDLNIQRA